MTRAVRAELVKLLRPKVLTVTAVTAVVFSIGAAGIVLASARPRSRRCRGGA